MWTFQSGSSVAFATLLGVLLGCSPKQDNQPAAKSDSVPFKYYVQLVRGNDSSQPPSPGAKAIGPKLSRQFHAVFNWQSYWEINRQEVALAPGQKTKLRLSTEREVEIDLASAGTRKVTAFVDGSPLGSSSLPVGEAMSIIGGDRDAKSVWFIVVRRDPPPD